MSKRNVVSNTNRTAYELKALGYCRVSTASSTVARIDRPDWVEVMARALNRAPADFYIPGTDSVAANWCDYYRRTLSTDKLSPSREVFQTLPASFGTAVGYVRSDGDINPEYKTPAALWRESGEADPHESNYDCERAALALGSYTDDELANEVFMKYDVNPPIERLLDGTALRPIVYVTAAKDRIRWLSRALEKELDNNLMLKDCIRDHKAAQEKIICYVEALDPPIGHDLRQMFCLGKN